MLTRSLKPLLFLPIIIVFTVAIINICFNHNLYRLEELIRKNLYNERIQNQKLIMNILKKEKNRFILFCVSMFLFLCIFYISNIRIVGSGDTIANRYVPFNIYKNSRIDLTNFDFFKNSSMWYLQHSENKVYSILPPGTFLMTLPFIAIADLTGILTPAQKSYSQVNLAYQKSFLWPVKIAAATYTALGVVLLFIYLSNFFSFSASYLTSMAIAFGTSVFSICAQDIWQHTVIFPLVATGLLLSLRAEPVYGISSGLLAAFSLLIRPTMIFMIIVLGVTYLLRNKKTSVYFALSFFIFYCFFNSARNIYFPVGGYMERLNLSDYLVDMLYFPIWKGLGGLLFSPSRGLLFYSPFLLIALIAPFFYTKVDRQQITAYSIVWIYIIFLYVSLQKKFLKRAIRIQE